MRMQYSGYDMEERVRVHPPAKKIYDEMMREDREAPIQKQTVEQERAYQREGSNEKVMV